MSQSLARNALGSEILTVTQSAPAGIPRARVRYSPSLALQTFDASQVAAFTLWNLTDKLGGVAPDSLDLFPLQSGYRDLRLNFTGDPITVLSYAIGSSTELVTGSISPPPYWSVDVPFTGPF